MGENDWIDEEGEEKKVELFLKWNIQLMSCWSKRKDLTQSDYELLGRILCVAGNGGNKESKSVFPTESNLVI